jgi:hypothetical protein
VAVIARILTALEVTSTAFWVGASAGFAFVQAPVAFGLVTDRDVFADLTEQTLARTATCTYVAGGIALTAAAARIATDRTAIVRAGAAAAAISAIAYHQSSIVPRMDTARRELGSFNDTPDDDPKRVAYRAMHKESTRVYGAALLLGTLQLVLAALPAGADAA